ncbi:MAG TPA: efflux RND transporter permease subunit [Ktedonobacteraceae bacterium]
MSGLWSFVSKIGLANRSVVALATIAILIVGGWMIPSLKQELYPSLEFPAVTVVTVYPGASPSIVEQDITDPLEQSIQGTQNIQTMTSYSNQSTSIIVVEYNFGTDINQASQQISQQINRVQGTLPSGSQAPQVQTFNVNSLPVIQLAATSDADPATLAADLQTKVVPALSGIDGVAQVNVTGVQDPVILITPDPVAMQKAGIKITDLMGPQSVLAANNINYPVGQATNNGQTFAITAGYQFKSIDDLMNLSIMGVKSTVICTPAQMAAAGPNAATQCVKSIPYQYKLSDVATIKQGVTPSTSLTRTNGQPSLGISITKNADGNTVNISQAVNDKLSSLESQLGNGAKLTVISDQAPQITSAVSGLVREGLIGAGFAILVILLFLFSIRSTLVTAISIPISIVIALIALSVGKLSLNLFTLGAMTIAVGRVVDDSIVVLENIYRHLGQGEDKQTAIPLAVREVAGAVTASTLTTVAVFLPIAGVGGFVGQVFGPFGITVAVSLLASLVVALFLIPVLAYWFLKAPKAKMGAKAASSHEKDTLLERGYVPAVRWVTGHKAISLIVALLLFIGSIALAPLLGTNFFSSSQQNTYSITQTLPIGTSMGTTNQDAVQVENVLSGMASIQHYQVTIGSSGMFSSLQGSSGGSNVATFSITTDPNADQNAFQADLQKRLNALSGVGQLQISTSQGGGFNSSGVSEDIQAPDQAKLEQATQQVLEAFKKVPDITNITSNLAAAAPLIDIQVDPARASKHGLSAQVIALALSDLYNNQTLMTVNFSGKQMKVQLQMIDPGLLPATVDGFNNLVVVATPAGVVKLGDVATVQQTLGPTQITHTGGQRTATVSATATTNNVGAVTQAVAAQIKKLSLPAGVTVVSSGVASQQSSAFSSLGLALVIAIILVYLVMVATFRSLMQPLILLISIPFAATGSLLLMLAAHTQLGVPSLIGLLMLVGIVVTNAIVLLDLVRQYRAQGMDARTAVIEGGRRRLRPILMTAIATILALLPMALGLSKDSGFIAAPLAVTVIGGLTSSTILTLLLVPTLYVLIEGRKDRKDAARPQSVPAPATPIEEQDTSEQVVVQSV